VYSLYLPESSSIATRGRCTSFLGADSPRDSILVTWGTCQHVPPPCPTIKVPISLIPPVHEDAMIAATIGFTSLYVYHRGTQGRADWRKDPLGLTSPTIWKTNRQNPFVHFLPLQPASTPMALHALRGSEPLRCTIQPSRLQNGILCSHSSRLGERGISVVRLERASPEETCCTSSSILAVVSSIFCRLSLMRVLYAFLKQCE